MHLFGSSLLKDLARWRQDLGGVLLWIGIPLAIGGLITLMMEGGGKPTGLLLVVDKDDSLISNAVAAAYTQGELGELLIVEKTTEEEGTARIDAGDGSALLLIPEGFGAAVLNAEPLTLTLRTNPAQTILPGIISEITEVLLDAGFYLHRLFAEEIDVITQLVGDGAPEDAVVAALSVAINDKLETVAPYVFEPAISVKFAEPADDEPAVPIAVLFLPGVILMAAMFSASGLAGDLWIEREQGSLRRIALSPGSLFAVFAGKAMAAGLVISAVCAVTLVIGFLYHGLDWSRLPSSLAWLFVASIALFSWFGVLQTLARTQSAATLLSSIVMFPLLMAGGSFFPFAALPGWIADIGRRTPNGFIADRLTGEIIAPAAWSIDLQSWLIVIVAALAGIALGGIRLQRSFARG